MANEALLILKKTLIKLTAQKAALEKEIRAVKSALTALGVMSPELAGRRHRRPMSAAERRTVGKRMKAYWAKRRRQRTSR